MEGEVERGVAGEFSQFSLKIKKLSGMSLLTLPKISLAQTAQTDICVSPSIVQSLRGHCSIVVISNRQCQQHYK